MELLSPPPPPPRAKAGATETDEATNAAARVARIALLKVEFVILFLRSVSQLA